MSTSNVLTLSTHRTFKIKKLKDAYGSDLDIDDIAGALFAEETPENRVIQVEQEFFGREISIPPTSNLRPQPLSCRKRVAEPHENNINKRARRTVGNNRDHLSQLPPIPNSQFDNVFPAPPVVASIGEISQGISQEEIIADSHPQNADVNGFSDILGAKSESLEESLTRLHAIPESNNSSSRGSPLLGEDTSHYTGNSVEEEDPDEVTTPESDEESDDDDDDDDDDGDNGDNGDGRNSNVSEVESQSHQPSNSQEKQISDPPDKSMTQGSSEQPNSGKESVNIHNPHSASSTPQAFPSSGLRSSNVATESGENLLGTKNVKRVLSFSPRPDHKQPAPDSTPKGNSVAATTEAQQVVDRGSIYSISSGKLSRSASEEITQRHNFSDTTSKKAQTSSLQRGSVGTLQRVEVPSLLSSSSQSKAWRPDAIDPDDSQCRASSNRNIRNESSEARIQKSASKGASRLWTEDEIRILLTAFHEGRDVKEIAGTLLPFRTVEACRKKLTSLFKSASTATNSHVNKGTRSITDNQDEESEVDDIFAEGSSASPAAKTLNVPNLVGSRGISLERSDKQACNGKLSKPKRQSKHSEAIPSSDNSNVNPILIRDQASVGSDEVDELDRSDAGVTVVRENGNLPSNHEFAENPKNGRLPFSSSKSNASAAIKSQLHSKQFSGLEKDDGLRRIQSQSSQNNASHSNHDRIASSKPLKTSGQLQRAKITKSKGSESKNNVRISFASSVT